jgi:hypothetical protein
LVARVVFPDPPLELITSIVSIAPFPYWYYATRLLAAIF